MSTLRIISGPSEGHSIECDRELVVGREGADLVVEDWEMSRRHAVIRPVGAGLEVEDLGSLNGTFVDGKRIAGATVLTGSATVKMGITQFAVEVTASAEPLLDTQRTVVSGAEREQAVADVSDRTTVRDVSDKPIVDVSDRTTVRDVPTEPAAPEPVAEASDRTTVRKVSDEPIVDVSDRTAVRDTPVFEVADKTTIREVVPQMVGEPPGDAPAGGPPAGAGEPGAPPGGLPPGGFPPGGPPPGFPAGGPPAPVRLLLKTPFGKRLMPLLFKMRQRRANRR